jgi:hypothetical protein
LLAKAPTGTNGGKYQVTKVAKIGKVENKIATGASPSKKESFSEKVSSLTCKTNLGMNVQFFFVVCCALQLDFQLAAYGNLRFPNTVWFYAWINIVLSAAILGFYAFLIFYGCKMFSKVLKLNSHPTDPNTKEFKWYFLKEELNPAVRGKNRYFQFFFMIKETVIGFVIIFSITDAAFQILPLVVLSILTIQFLFSNKPYKEKRMNVLSIVEEFAFLAVFIIMLWIH